MKSPVIFGLALSAVLLIPGLSRAVDVTDKVQVHAFGSWFYGKTSANSFGTGTEEGDYDNLQFALNVSAEPSDRLSINGQIDWEHKGGEEEIETELDFAFAQWEFAEWLKFRAGRLQQPFGIYTEIFDVGTLYPFSSPPFSVYGSVGIVTEGVDGAGFTGNHAWGDWDVDYDIYFGQLHLEEVEPWAVLAGEAAVGDPIEAESEEIKNVIGGRFVIETPLIEGLRFGASAYTGEGIEEGGEKERVWVAGPQIEYAFEPFGIRAEYYHKASDETVDAGYVEGDFRFYEDHIQLAGLFAWVETDSGVDVSLAPSVEEHKVYGIALNYWFNSHFVIKTAYRFVDGNRLAVPAEDNTPIATGMLEEQSHLAEAGVSFSF
ncbi:MAG: hypothetical protein AB1405_12785 [Bdellovibrionota bacterium]